VGADLPDEADGHADRRDDQAAHGGRSPRPDEPPDGHPDRQDDKQPAADARASRHASTPPETRDHEEYYIALRKQEAAEKAVAARQATADEQAAYEKWEKDAEDSRWMWNEYQRRWPPSERPKVNRPDSEEGCWQGEGDSYLSRPDNERVEAACDQIAKREKEKITPAMREIESQDPDRHLVGLEHCRKGRDRIKEKIYGTINDFSRTPEQAVSLVPDTLRFTFEYREPRYTQGAWADTERLKEQGFKLEILKNFWSDEQYKGINSQWIEPESGQRFEVQFHTRISFEAKELTHKAYERIRTHQTDKFEQMVLEAFQKKVTAEVPTPLGATDIPDHTERDTHAR
jgi:hypothetical protein